MDKNMNVICENTTIELEMTIPRLSNNLKTNCN